MARRRASWSQRTVLLAPLVMLLLFAAGPAWATEPAPSASPVVIDPGDPRSEGEGPGGISTVLLVGAGVVLLGLATAGITLVAIRLQRRS